MAPPSPTVEVAFDAPWNATSPTWVDVTSYVEAGRYDRRYGWETGLYQGGAAEFMLVDADRALDPWHATGAYYGQFRPNTQVRVSLGATVVWSGFAESWLRSWSPHGRGTTTLRCFDGWALLAQSVSQALAGAALVDSALVGVGLVGGSFSVGTAQELTSDRVTAVLNAAAWPSAWRTIDTGAVYMPAESVEQPLPLHQILSLATAAELGHLFIGKDGYLVFVDRFSAATDTTVTTSQVTFSDVPGDTAVRFLPISAEYNARDLINRVTITRPGSDLAIVHEDAASIATYGERGVSLADMRVIDDAQALANAQRIIASSSGQLTQIPPITFDVISDTSEEYDAAAGLELHHRVTVKVTPPGGGAGFESDFHVYGIAGQWRAGEPLLVTAELADAALVDRLEADGWDVVGTAVVGTATAAY